VGTSLLWGSPALAGAIGSNKDSLKGGSEKQRLLLEYWRQKEPWGLPRSLG
jgi:hypothetical protein